MNYYCCEIQAPSEKQEILMAFLADLPFDSFEETEESLRAFMPESAYSPELKNEVDAVCKNWQAPPQWSHIVGKNWNKLWESNFPPLLIGNFCGVRAPFHPPFVGTKHEIVIQPKMAFGTGHHETTHMMIQMMEKQPLGNKIVLDFGCGTGILAILAGLSGARRVDALDIEEPAIENTIENAQLNSVEVIFPLLGSLDRLPAPAAYDVILANINRNVILDTLPSLYKMMAGSGSTILVSGIMKQDEEKVLERAAETKLELHSYLHRGQWVCLEFHRTA